MSAESYSLDKAAETSRIVGRARILVAEGLGFPESARHRLSEAGDVDVRDLNRSGLLAEVSNADVLWVRLRHRVDEQLLEQGERLKFIVSPTTGLNHIDLDAAERRNIEVLSLRGETALLRNVRATAELTVGLVLMLLRRLPYAARDAAQGAWNRDAFKGHELHGKTVGLVGYGRLGQLVAQCLQGFDVRILATDPNVVDDAARLRAALVPLEALLDESDVVSLHINLDRSTEGFFGREQFMSMKRGAWFINTARGELVDEGALLDALDSGHLAGAALDVLCGESAEGMAEHPLVAYAGTHDNLILTPHIGGCTFESMEKTELHMAEKLHARLIEAFRG
jgi:D-3-phosphoglycerate dehydrogenase